MNIYMDSHLDPFIMLTWEQGLVSLYIPILYSSNQIPFLIDRHRHVVLYMDSLPYLAPYIGIDIRNWLVLYLLSDALLVGYRYN